MNAGQLNSKIKIYKMTETVSPVLGTTEQKPELLKSTRAAVVPRTGSLLSGREAGTMLSKTTHAITVRSEILKDMTDSCYIMWTDSNGGSHKFDIDYILPPNRTRYSTIYCSEVVKNVV